MRWVVPGAAVAVLTVLALVVVVAPAVTVVREVLAATVRVLAVLRFAPVMLVLGTRPLR